ncbi:hemicentin-1-like isoform X2 [Tachypleus tridentatus]|uniref:hemicentin-1-like isoform X2 n=1 Tax=Tachypleus tridentatus TaxID=6853 RepID=UPI003FD54788
MSSLHYFLLLLTSCCWILMQGVKAKAKPSSPIITKDGNVLKSSRTIGPFIEGTTLSLECKSTGGKPAPEVTWWNGSESLPSRLSSTEDDLGISNVTSSTRFVISRGDLGTKLRCKVKNDAISKELVAWVEVDVHVKPSSLEIEGPSDPVVAGNTVLLTCTIEGAKPAGKATWYNQSKIVEPQPHSRSELMSDGTFKTVSQLEITVSRFDHLGTFYCKGTNPVIQQKGDVPLLKSTDLEVSYLPVVVAQPVGGLIVKETKEATFFCSFDANPSNITSVTWYKDGVELMNNEDQKLEVGGLEVPTLTIRNVSRTMRGLYHCSLRNSIGLGNATNAVDLNVLYPPSVEVIILPASVNEGDNKNVSLLCDIVDGNPQNLIRTRWYKNQELLDVTTGREVVWQNIDRNFTANYSCEGENSAGWGDRSEPQELIVNYLPGPTAVIEQSPPAVKGNPATLKCTVEDMGRPPANAFHWEHSSQVLPVTSQKLTIESMDINTIGDYTCSAVNAVGAGPAGKFYLSVQAPPAIIHYLPKMHGAPYDAKTISLFCRIECEPLCEVEWFKNEERLKDSYLYSIEKSIVPGDKETGYFTSIISTLEWNMTAWPGGVLDHELDNANYTCASSENNAGPGVSTSSEFRVEYPPDNVTVSVEHLDILEGNVPGDINCSAISWPPSEYKWKFSGKIIGYSSQLSLNYSISRERAGTYECVASNRHGKAVANTVINVMYNPECTIYQDGETVIVCQAQANPNTVNFTWMKNNDTLDYSVEDTTRSVLELGDSRLEHFGKYYCIVNNSIGESVPCMLELTGVVGTAGWGPGFVDESLLIIVAVVAAIIVVFIIVVTIILMIVRRRTHGSGSPKKKTYDCDPVYQNANRKENGSPVAETENKPMYENMTFHQKRPKGPFRPDISDDMLYADMYDDVKLGKIPDPRMKPPLPPKGIGKEPKEPPVPPKTKRRSSKQLGV